MGHPLLIRILADGDAFEREMGNYDTPQGHRAFIEGLARLLRQTFGWEVGPDNIALTNGSQTAFFILFNMLGGSGADGVYRKIMLPLTPEYIGYADQGIEDDLFRPDGIAFTA